MKISIIIPAYQQAEFLPDTLDSLLSQTRPPDEVVLVNDGSTDATLAIAEKYQADAHPFKFKVISQVNKGLASARNTGIMNTTGEYILPLDSDDMLQDNALERLEQVAKDTKADIIAPSMKCFGVENQTVILMANPTLNDFIQANRIPYCSLVRKSALLECGGYSSRMVHGWEDWHLWFDLLKRGKKLVTIPEPLLLYRTRPNSMVHTAAEHGQELSAQINKDFFL